MPPSSYRERSNNQGDIVRFLSAPESYPEHTQRVSVIETHHAWVFLTDDHAYKMKKAFRRGRFDFSELDSRRHLCNEEYRLNRPLAARTYLGVVDIVIESGGQLAIGGHGRVVEWLVKMRRLPRESALPVAAGSGTLKPSDVHGLLRKLLRFYRHAPDCRSEAREYVRRLQDQGNDVYEELRRPQFGFPSALVEDVFERQVAYIGANAEVLGNRGRDGFVREIHGDLRPEHVFLIPDAEPEIIDRLEFDRDLRCIDVVEELAFFGLECRVIGQQWIEDECIDWYGANGDDEAPRHLWNFYGARRASMRAMLSAWHTLDQDDGARWLSRGRDYLGLALHYLRASAIV